MAILVSALALEMTVLPRNYALMRQNREYAVAAQHGQQILEDFKNLAPSEINEELPVSRSIEGSFRTFVMLNGEDRSLRFDYTLSREELTMPSQVKADPSLSTLRLEMRFHFVHDKKGKLEAQRSLVMDTVYRSGE
jgi:hypothetical protein